MASYKENGETSIKASCKFISKALRANITEDELIDDLLKD